MSQLLNVEYIWPSLSRDLMAWLNSMAALMSSDELAKDVSSAEALLEAQQVRIGTEYWTLFYIMLLSFIM